MLCKIRVLLINVQLSVASACGSNAIVWASGPGAWGLGLGAWIVPRDYGSMPVSPADPAQYSRFIEVKPRSKGGCSKMTGAAGHHHTARSGSLVSSLLSDRRLGTMG